MNPNENLDSPTVLLRRLHRWRMAFFGLVILLAGLTMGVAATLLTLHHAGRRPPDQRTMGHFDFRGIEQRLHLSREQAEQIRPILDKYMQKLDEIREQGRFEIVKQLQLMNEEISAVLKGDQERLWRQLMQDLPVQVPHGPPWGHGPGPGPMEGLLGPPHVPAAGSPRPDANTVDHN